MLHRLRRASIQVDPADASPVAAATGVAPKPIRPARKHSSGFTLVELMVVMLIISILLAIAVPSYISAIRSAREAALREDLHTMRDAIEQYTEDKEQAPQSLDDLVQAGYLKALPIDPMTHRADSWVPDQSDSYSSVDQSQTGINDVHSGSDQVGGNGEPYSQW
jgi:general secretion pathway protein G